MTQLQDRGDDARAAPVDAADPALAPEPPPPADPITAALAAGDHRGALTLMMQRHGGALHRYVRHQLRDAALADDVHQQVFIEAYRDLPRFAGRSSVRTWLIGIARHRCLDALKGQRRRAGRFPLEAALALDEPDPAPGADHQLDHARALEALAGCLGALAPAAREAVLLRFRDGLAYDQIAAARGERAGTVQQRVARALPVLRRCLEARQNAGLTRPR